MEREGAAYRRVLDDGREITVYPMLFQNFRLCVGAPYESTYDDAWCYPNEESAMQAAREWDGKTKDPPDGWVRHIASGRRRINGDPKTEYVQI